MENTEKILKALEKNISDLLKIMNFSDFDVQVELLDSLEGGKKTLAANIKIDETPGVLIGEYGKNLSSLQHIVHLMLLGQKIISDQDGIQLVLDVNDYRKSRVAKIHAMVESLAKEVMLNREPVILEPMSAYERRIVHIELEKNSMVTTESIGEEPRRRVVIRPKTEDNDLNLNL